MSVDGSTRLPPNAELWPPDNSSLLIRKQILRFLCTGGASVAIDLLVYISLIGSLDSASSKGISYIAGMLFGFIANKFWTFESPNKSLAEPAIYVVLYACTLAVNVGLNACAFDVFLRWWSAERTSQMAAFLVATAVTTVLNFAGLKYLTFRRPKPLTQKVGL